MARVLGMCSENKNVHDLSECSKSSVLLIIRSSRYLSTDVYQLSSPAPPMLNRFINCGHSDRDGGGCLCHLYNVDFPSSSLT